MRNGNGCDAVLVGILRLLLQQPVEMATALSWPLKRGAAYIAGLAGQVSPLCLNSVR
ncbi:hypothetical protein OK016_08780 [Vibrio chagasii]|nr:hypothetical protein [Vibrio chagasii]